MNKTVIATFFLFSCYAVSGQRLDTIPNLPEHYRERLADFRSEPIVNGGIIFLGNSITEGGNWKKLLGDSLAINRGISGDNTFGILNRIGEVTVRQPAKLFLLIGINDLSKNIPEEVILGNLITIVSRVHRSSPNTIVYVESIFPLNAGHEKFPEKFLNKESQVLTINTQLRKYAARMKFTFVDLYGEFTDSEGKLEKTYTTDGLHLNASGYAQWVKILKREKYL